MYIPRRRRRYGPLLSLLIVLVALGGGGYLVYSLIHQQVSKDATGLSNGATATISMHAHPTIVIEQCSGYAHIHGMSTLTDTVTLAGSDIPNYTQNQTRNQVIIEGCDLTIGVPVQTDLIIDADSIDVFGVQGHMQLSVNGGTITVLQSTLEGDSKLDNNGGPIRFSGTLAPQSTPTLDTNGGMLSIGLAPDASFHLTITGILNGITTDFPGLKAPDGLGGNDVKVDIGSAPTATLTLTVNDSPIVLTAQS